MSAKILQFTGGTTLDLPPDQVIDAATGRLNKVLIIGYDKDDKLYAAASCGSVADAMYMLEKVKRQLLEFGED